MTHKMQWYGDGACCICGERSTGYYDMTCGPIGDFREWCPEHKEVVAELCHIQELERMRAYQELKEWTTNYIPHPREEI